MNRIPTALCALAITFSYGVVYLPPEVAHGLLVEDGPVEQATLAFFLFATLGLLRSWQLRAVASITDGPATERRLFYLILAGLMFICAGEEISWGQRIFGWQTPASWSAKNAQSETNLHNLTIIEGGVRDAASYTFWRSLTNANRLFALFWLALFVVVPVLNRISPQARRLFGALGLPIAAPWFGGLFLLNHLTFHFAGHHLAVLHIDSTELFPLDELKEQNDAFVYAVMAMAAWLRERARLHASALSLRKA